MKDPPPFLPDATDFERRLLDAAKAEQIPNELKLHMSTALRSSAATAALSGKGSRWSLSGKPAAWTMLSLAVLGAAAGWQQLGKPGRALRAHAPQAAEPRAVETPHSEPQAAASLAPSAAASGEARVPTSPAPALAPSTKANLRDEIALLDRARSALTQGTPKQALLALELHARRFTRGTLLPEAEALRIEALLANGDDLRAHERARRFLSAYPSNPLRERVERLIAPAAQGAHDAR